MLDLHFSYYCTWVTFYIVINFQRDCDVKRQLIQQNLFLFALIYKDIMVEGNVCA